MADFRVTCIKTIHPHNHPSHITQIGVGNPLRIITLDRVIRHLEIGEHRFYVVDPETWAVAWVRVVYADQPYIRSTADDSLLDNLLTLPQIA